MAYWEGEAVNLAHHRKSLCRHRGAAQHFQSAVLRLPAGLSLAENRALTSALSLMSPHRTCCRSGLPCCASHCAAGCPGCCMHVRVGHRDVSDRLFTTLWRKQ